MSEDSNALSSQSDWQSYICKMNGEIASVFVDLNFAMTAIPATKPKLAWLWIRLNSPLDNGLSSDDEFVSLCDFEDDLQMALVPIKTCQYAGRITTKGRREFYFYVSRNFDFQKAVDDVLTKHREYRFQLGEKLDVSMDHYFLTLLPGNNGRDQIERRRTEQ